MMSPLKILTVLKGNVKQMCYVVEDYKIPKNIMMITTTECCNMRVLETRNLFEMMTTMMLVFLFMMTTMVVCTLLRIGKEPARRKLVKTYAFGI